MGLVKDFLASLDPPLPKRLPTGAIEILARHHSLHEKSVGQMLRGRYGSEERIKLLYLSAIELMQDNIESIEQERIDWMERIAAADNGC